MMYDLHINSVSLHRRLVQTSSPGTVTGVASAFRFLLPCLDLSHGETSSFLGLLHLCLSSPGGWWRLEERGLDDLVPLTSDRVLFSRDLTGVVVDLHGVPFLLV